MGVVFDWDPVKARINEKKHGVKFDDAVTVFFDQCAHLISDPGHSVDEDRFLLLGRTWTWQILVVSHTYRDFSSTIKLYPPAKPMHLKKQCTEITMRDNYDFSNSTPNPYAKRLKKQVTIRLETGTIEYFKELAEEIGIPYQTLINLYLRDCAMNKRKLVMDWKPDK